MTQKLRFLLFVLAFIEGGGVMCVELCGAKLLSPYFGTSIYVWAAVLGITLAALMVGYFAGGFISSRNQHPKVFCWLMLIAGCLVILIPAICEFILPFTINLSLGAGAIASLFCFLFFPLALFGAVSPLIINALTQNAKDSGKSSGNVYAVSTLGGITATFLVGFYTLPTFGITITLYAYGFLIVFAALLMFIAIRGFKLHILVLVGIAFAGFNFKNQENEQIIYESDGILGNIKVVDRQFFDGKIYRELMVNNISQTMMHKENHNLTLWPYADILTYNMRSYSAGKEALLLGLGGGTLYKQLKSNSMNADVVEIDARIERLAKKYFFVEDDLNVVIDDARHFIRTTEKKYDVIIYDLYNSETPPVHLMTNEAFLEIKEHLNPSGLLIINFYGFVYGAKGKAARSLYKTLLHQQYDVKLIATPGEEKNRNLLFFCGKNKLTATAPVIHHLIPADVLNFDDAVLLTDDKPILEHLYLEAALQWRKDYNEMNAKQFLDKKQ